MSLALLADLTQILAEVFLEPDADLNTDLALLREGEVSPALAEPLGRMVENPLDRAAQPVEYARLFLHAKDTDVVHLFESVQARGHHMAPDVLVPLKAIYDEADISLQEGLGIPPDHLGLEFACLNFLLVQVIEGDLSETARFVTLAQRLIREHLLPFTQAVAKQLPLVEAHAYYLAATELALTLLLKVQGALAIDGLHQ